MDWLAACSFEGITKMMKSTRYRTVVFVLLSICCETALAQFPTSNPIPGAIPKSELQFRLEKVVQIPMYADVQPRLELLTFNGDGSGDLYVNDQFGDLYRFNPSDPESVTPVSYTHLTLPTKA